MSNLPAWYRHWGTDPEAILRAIWDRGGHVWLTGDEIRGFSLDVHPGFSPSMLIDDLKAAKEPVIEYLQASKRGPGALYRILTANMGQAHMIAPASLPFSEVQALACRHYGASARVQYAARSPGHIGDHGQ